MHKLRSVFLLVARRRKMPRGSLMKEKQLRHESAMIQVIAPCFLPEERYFLPLSLLGSSFCLCHLKAPRQAGRHLRKIQSKGKFASYRPPLMVANQLLFSGFSAVTIFQFVADEKVVFFLSFPFYCVCVGARQ